MNKLFILLALMGLATLCSCDNHHSAPPTSHQNITGAAGFILGEKLDVALAEKPQKDGGYFYMGSFTNSPPFDRVWVSADANRIIYSITLQSSRHVDYAAETALIDALEQKYGEIGDTKKNSSREIKFGDTPNRSLVLTRWDRNQSLDLTYTDNTILTAFLDDKAATNKAAIVKGTSNL